MTKKESTAEAVMSLWDFPTEGVTIEAESYEAAVAKLEKLKSPTVEAIVSADEN